MAEKQDVILLLRNHYLDMPDPPGIPIQFENRDLEQDPDNAWVRETFLLASSQPYDQVCERHEAIYQLDFHCRVASGMELTNSIVSKTKKRFTPRSLTDGNNHVVIYRTQELPSFTRLDATVTPLLIYVRYFEPIPQA